MAGEQYGDRAVAALDAFAQANLQTYLTKVETDQSLAVGYLTPPDEYIQEYRPADPKSVMQFFYTTGGPVDRVNGLYEYNCVIAWIFPSDCDTGTGQKDARRRETAIANMIASDRTLGGLVVQAIDEDQSVFAEKPGGAQVLHAISLGVAVMVQEI